MGQLQPDLLQTLAVYRMMLSRQCRYVVSFSSVQSVLIIYYTFLLLSRALLLSLAKEQKSMQDGQKRPMSDNDTYVGERAKYETGRKQGMASVSWWFYPACFVRLYKPHATLASQYAIREGAETLTLRLLHKNAETIPPCTQSQLLLRFGRDSRDPAACQRRHPAKRHAECIVHTQV